MGKESMESFGLTSRCRILCLQETQSLLGPRTTANIGRAGQPVECATCFVFLASVDSSYVTAQCM